MVTADQIGCSVVIKAADHFYSYVDGWRGKLVGFDSGLCLVEVIQKESAFKIRKIFYVPPEQVEPE